MHILRMKFIYLIPKLLPFESCSDFVWLCLSSLSETNRRLTLFHDQLFSNCF